MIILFSNNGSKLLSAQWTITRKFGRCAVYSLLYEKEMYRLWLKDPNNVSKEWDSHFRRQKSESKVNPPSKEVQQNDLTRGSNPVFSKISQKHELNPILKTSIAKYSSASAAASSSDVEAYLALQDLIMSYQSRGYILADIDPLKLPATYMETMSPPDKINDFEYFTEKDLDRGFELPPITFIGGQQKSLSLREIIKRLKHVYCGTMSVEYMHIQNLEQATWVKQRVETPGAYDITKNERITCLHRMLNAGAFEAFCARKWASEKRFGLEGCDALIPLINFIMDKSAELGVNTFVIGMPHRGRLNLFTNICRMPLNSVFVQFHGLQPEEEGCGDVKYHLGTSMTVRNSHTNRDIKVIVIANPSHLEAIGGVILGRVRSEQFFTGDKDQKKVMAILFHGDAAYCGQGVVYETTQLSDLKDYGVGGTIHIVVNNQIGYTAEPRMSRSGHYCTDLGKVNNSLILHVNAEDPDRTIPVAKIASEFRQKFGKDVVIDLTGYRRLGHNESDEPMFTNPTMYAKIRAMTPAWQAYGQRLVKEGTVTEADVKKYVSEFDANCQKELDLSLKAKSVRMSDWLDSPWPGWFKGKDLLKFKETGVTEDILMHIAKKFSQPPPADLKFEIHKGIEKILKSRQDLVAKKIADWPLSEAIAFGSLLKEGIHVRLSGLDSQRGTFSQRHHVIHDQSKNGRYISLSNLWPDQAVYQVCNSPVSEYGVITYEAGYSMTDPRCLTIWEGQYGDFVNSGQPAIDLFVNSGESKWIRQSGLVMLLPHGMEGMGPDHSSARVERFLQLTDDDREQVPEFTPDFESRQINKANWIVANCSVPANYFHILRRQIAMPIRKPLVLFTPKMMIWNPAVRSSFDEMLVGTKFRRIIPDDGPASKNPEGAKRLIFCTGKVYFDLKKERAKRKLDEKVVLTRIEQLSPVPYDLIDKECTKYSKADLVWAQEEHKNNGAWSYLRPRFKTLLKGKRTIKYSGRAPSTVSATPSKYNHMKEIEDLFNSTFQNL